VLSSEFKEAADELFTYTAAFSSRKNHATIFDITPQIKKRDLLSAFGKKKGKIMPDFGVLGALYSISLKSKAANLEIKSSADHEPSQPGIIID
jgi:hypothetical protein